MKKWTQEQLEKEGYKIENAKITSVDLSMADHGCLTLSMALEGDGWGCVYGGYCLGNGYVGAKPEHFKANGSGMIYLMRIMDTVDCDYFNDMKGKYVRVATKGWGGIIKIIGHITKNKWFDAESFFEDCKKEKIVEVD